MDLIVGYRVEADTINIRHPDHPGLLVVARSVALGRVLEIQRTAASVDQNDGPSVEAFVAQSVGVFMGAVVEWNLEYEDGTPVPVTVEGLLSLPNPRLPYQLLRAWQEGLAAVDAPLKPASSSGGNSPEVPIPMVPRSSGRAS